MSAITAFENRVANPEYVCAQSRTVRARVRFLRHGHWNVSMIYVFVVLEVGNPRIVHWNTTEHPTAK